MEARVALRWIITADVVTSWASLFLPLFGVNLEISFADEMSKEASWVVPGVALLFISSNLVGWFGMWLLEGWGRSLYVVSWILSLALLAMSRGAMLTAWGRIYECLVGLTGGFLLCFVFTGDGRKLFQREDPDAGRA